MTTNIDELSDFLPDDYDNRKFIFLLAALGAFIMIAKFPALRTKKWRNYVPIAIALLGVGVLGFLFFQRRRRRREVGDRTQQAPLTRSLTPLTATGLTGDEAAARLEPGQNNQITIHSQLTRRQLLRDGLLTIFNLNLIGLVFVQALLSRPLDALITLGVLILNVGVNVFQEEFTRYRVRSLKQSIRSQATVIRDGKPHRIEVDQIVVGDVLPAGPGDQIMVDGTVNQGRLVVDESLLSGDNARLHKKPGDPLYAGSICFNGRATYQAEQVGDKRRIVRQLQETSDSREALTPIEHIMNRVMRVLLVLIIVLGAILLTRYFRLDAIAMTDVYIDAANVIFNLAPAGLFFMVILTYVTATADLARIGALVRRARSVESLAQIDVMCFARAGFLTGTTVEIRSLPTPEGDSPPDEETLRQVLGDFARSTSDSNQIVQAIAGTFGGTRRLLQTGAGLLSVYGWSALVFDDKSWQGVYVLGDPQILQASQISEVQEESQETKQTRISPAAIRQRMNSLTNQFSRLLRRGNDHQPADQKDESVIVSAIEPQISENKASELPETKETPSSNIFGRFRQRAMDVLRRTQVEPDVSRADREISSDETILTLAHAPEVVSLYDEDGLPQLPQGLIPLCNLSYLEKIRPEAIEAIRTFADRQVEMKIFTPDNPAKTHQMLLQAATAEQIEIPQISAITGPELVALEPEEMARAVKNHTIFGQVSPEQTEQIVQVLRQSGHAVGVFGDSVSDVAAMRQADLALTRRSSSPAALSVADIILLDDSPQVLSRVLDKGQRIVNGLLDVLKLYLTQAFYLLLLIVGIQLLAYGFPYSSAQGGLVALLTLTVPAIGLSLWAIGVQLPAVSLGRVLTQFIWPASLTMGLAGLVVYTLFLQRYDSYEYAQLAVTYALVFQGLLLVIFVKPPIRFAWNRLPLVADLRPTLLVVATALVFMGMIHIPLAQQLFKITPLQLPEHYLLIGLVVVAWALGVRFLWFIIPLEYRVRTSALSKISHGTAKSQD